MPQLQIIELSAFIFITDLPREPKQVHILSLLSPFLWLERQTRLKDQGNQKRFFSVANIWFGFVFMLFCPFLLLSCVFSYSNILLFLRREGKPVSDFHHKINGPFIQRNLAQSPNRKHTELLWGWWEECVHAHCTSSTRPHQTQSSVGSKGSQLLVHIQPIMSSQQTLWVDSVPYLFSLPHCLTHSRVPGKQCKCWKPLCPGH